MNPQDLAAARRVAQEAREDVGAAHMPRHTMHDVAGLVDALVGEAERLIRGCSAELRDVQAELAPALGYEHDEEYGWVVGDHTSVTLAMEARQTIGQLSKRVDELEDLARRMFAVLDHYGYLHSVEPERDHEAFWAEYHEKMGEKA